MAWRSVWRGVARLRPRTSPEHTVCDAPRKIWQFTSQRSSPPPPPLLPSTLRPAAASTTQPGRGVVSPTVCGEGARGGGAVRGVLYGQPAGRPSARVQTLIQRPAKSPAGRRGRQGGTGMEVCCCCCYFQFGKASLPLPSPALRPQSPRNIRAIATTQ